MKLVPLWLCFLSSVTAFNNPPKRIKLHVCYASLTDEQNESSYRKYLPLWLQLQNWAHFQLSDEKKHGWKSKWNLAQGPLQNNSSISWGVLYFAPLCQTFAGGEIKNSLLTENLGILFQSILIVLSTILFYRCYVNKITGSKQYYESAWKWQTPSLNLIPLHIMKFFKYYNLYRFIDQPMFKLSEDFYFWWISIIC